jgi:peptidoglycan/xylan/chitin deacetylase (PgdA/CDA1 family)
MFHAIGELSDGDWADPHYSFSDEKFKDFLKQTKKVVSLKNTIKNKINDSVVVTFDDGHISNYFAAKYMFENNYGSADFFINPERVGDEFYMTWQHINELCCWGMSIQSHGLDHQYLSDCDDSELDRQLRDSKNIIEQHTNQPVTILAPPGGRFDKRTSQLAADLGYQCIANSQPGKVRNIDSYHFSRFAVLTGYSVNDLLSAQKKINIITLKLQMKYVVLKIIKTLLGNARYDKIRIKLIGLG